MPRGNGSALQWCEHTFSFSDRKKGPGVRWRLTGRFTTDERWETLYQLGRPRSAAVLHTEIERIVAAAPHDRVRVTAWQSGAKRQFATRTWRSPYRGPTATRGPSTVGAELLPKLVRGSLIPALDLGAAGSSVITATTDATAPQIEMSQARWVGPSPADPAKRIGDRSRTLTEILIQRHLELLGSALDELLRIGVVEASGLEGYACMGGHPSTGVDPLLSSPGRDDVLQQLRRRLSPADYKQALVRLREAVELFADPVRVLSEGGDA